MSDFDNDLQLLEFLKNAKSNNNPLVLFSHSQREELLERFKFLDGISEFPLKSVFREFFILLSQELDFSSGYNAYGYMPLAPLSTINVSRLQNLMRMFNEIDTLNTSSAVIIRRDFTDLIPKIVFTYIMYHFDTEVYEGYEVHNGCTTVSFPLSNFDYDVAHHGTLEAIKVSIKEKLITKMRQREFVRKAYEMLEREIICTAFESYITREDMYSDKEILVQLMILLYHINIRRSYLESCILGNDGISSKYSKETLLQYIDKIESESSIDSSQVMEKANLPVHENVDIIKIFDNLGNKNVVEKLITLIPLGTYDIETDILSPAMFKLHDKYDVMSYLLPEGEGWAERNEAKKNKMIKYYAEHREMEGVPEALEILTNDAQKKESVSGISSDINEPIIEGVQYNKSMHL